MKYFLGIEVASSSEGLFLHQHKYALNILIESGMLSAKPTSFPMEQNHMMSYDTGEPLFDASRYLCLVGRLLYLPTTRLDIMYLIHILSEFMQHLRQGH